MMLKKRFNIWFNNIWLAVIIKEKEKTNKRKRMIEIRG